MNLASITRLLPSGYSARFVPSDDPQSEDDEIKIMLHGVEAPWSIQCCLIGGGYAVNEYGFENGEIAWAKHHGHHRSLVAAFKRLAKEMSK